jgi:hypothetical protein
VIGDTVATLGTQDFIRAFFAADKRRHYQNRFVWFDSGSRLQGVIRPFFFSTKRIELAAVWPGLPTAMGC